MRSGNEKLVKYLIKKKADGNKKDRWEETPQFDACESGNENLVKYLIEKGVDINKENQWGETPLFKL